MSEPVRWTIAVSDETDRAPRAFLDDSGLASEDLAAFVEDAVRWRLMDRRVQTIKDRNVDTDPEALRAAIDEAVRSAREESVVARQPATADGPH
jgi:hypothetical protein